MEPCGSVMVVGSANMDLVFAVERFPNPGETRPGMDFKTFPGGKGANQAVAAAKLGARVEFVGKVGGDLFGESLRQSLAAAGVDLRSLETETEAPSGTAGIFVDRSGQNEIVVVPGANGRVDPDQVRRSIERSSGVQVVLAQCETPIAATLEAFRWARSAGVATVFNPAPAIALPEEAWPLLDFITPNESECEFLTGTLPRNEGSCAEAARVLLDRGVRNVVITLGASGCYWTNGPEHLTVPSIQVQPVDTTAAGDAFNGALALFLAHGCNVHDALALANRVGALSTTKPGAQPSMPTWADVEAVL